MKVLRRQSKQMKGLVQGHEKVCVYVYTVTLVLKLTRKADSP